MCQNWITCLFLAWFFWTISIETLASYNGIGSSSWGLKWKNEKCWWAHPDRQKYHRTGFTFTVPIPLPKQNKFYGFAPGHRRKKPQSKQVIQERSLLQGKKKRVVGRVLLHSSCYPALREGISHSHLIMGVFPSPEALLRRVHAQFKNPQKNSTTLTWKCYLIISPWHLPGWVSKRTVKEQQSWRESSTITFAGPSPVLIQTQQGKMKMNLNSRL